jgi:competence protein ComEC
VRSPLVAVAVAFLVGAVVPPSRLSAPVTVGCLPALALGRWALLPFAGLGWVARSAASSARDPGARATAAAEVLLDGVVSGVPERFGDRVRYPLRDRSGALLLVWSASPSWPLALGDEVRLAATLRAPEGARNPGGRDPAALLASRGIAWEAHARAAPLRTRAPSPLVHLEVARREFARLAAQVLPAREAGLTTAIATGDRTGIDPATNDAFARSGLAHVLSVSGMHLSVVVYGFFRLLRAAFTRWDRLAERVDARRAAAWTALPFTALYAVATGASMPVIRSAIGTAGALVAVAAGRESRALEIIALALLCVVAAEPGAVLDPSFQLSFASVAALATLTAPLRRALPVPPPRPGAGRLRRAGEWLVTSVCASAAASLATAAIVACHFRRLPLAGVLANVPGVPIGSALTVTATAAAMLSAAFPSAAVPVLWLCRPLASALLAVNDLFASLPGAAPAIAAPGVPCIAAAATCALFASRRRGWTRAALSIAAAGLVVAPGPVRGWAASARGDVLEVVFLGVGQGDCALLRLPDGAAVLVDAGGEANARVDPGTRDIVPFLRDAGVSRIAAVFLSHGDADHVVGLPAIADALPIERVFTSGPIADAAAGAMLAGSPRPEHLAAGDVWQRGGVRFEVLAPPASGGQLDENDGSLVLRVVHGRSTLLFLGDVEHEGEAALLAAADPAALRADVVKVAHHGSRTSSSEGLVEAARARFAVISSGKDNRFRFPADEVVDRWRAVGAEVVRTDQGAVRFVSDGSGVRRTPAKVAVDALALLRERL